MKIITWLKNKTNIIPTVILIALFVLPFGAGAQNDKDAFGDSIPISNGLMGKIFLLPDTTTMLPNFDTMSPLASRLYTQKMDIPGRSWSAGFPGLRNRFEWFGIEYTGTFKSDKAGKYVFRLLSDDGSKLFIDGKLAIDNDGVHSSRSKSVELLLSDSVHTIKLQYFQGPRYQIALQLFYTFDTSKEQVFPGKNFVLHTNSPSNFLFWLLLALGIIVLLALLLVLKKKKKTI
jgi:fumarate reductase subunit D